MKEQGALIASVHPIKTFTDAEAAVQTFPGTFCSAEGDAEALAVLRPAFERDRREGLRHRRRTEARLSRRAACSRAITWWR